MSANLHGELQPLQAQPKLNALEQSLQAILAEKARCEAIRAEILSCEEKIKSINEDWLSWVSWGKEDELLQLQKKIEALELQEKQSQERLAKLTTDVAREEEQQIKAQEKQRAEALRTLQGLLIEQQRQEKQKLTYSKYGFEILENEAALNEINTSDSIIYVAPVAKDASGQSTNRYVCKVFPPHDENIVDVKPVILFYIEAGDVYDIIHFRVAKRLLRKEFELLQKQQFNSQDDAFPMIEAYLEKIDVESQRCKKKPTTPALEWLWKKDMGEFRQELRSLKTEAEQLLRQAEVAKIETTAALFKTLLAKASNREEIDGWNIAFSIAIAQIKSVAVRTALDKIRETEFSLRVSDAFLIELSTLEAKVSLILERQQQFPTATDSKIDFITLDVVVEINQKIKEINVALAKTHDEGALRNLRKANDIAERLLIDLQDAFEENEDNTAYPLHNGVSNGETAIVRIDLNGLNDEAKIKAAQEKNARGHTPLDVAIITRNQAMVELLFELIPGLDLLGMNKERALEKLQNMNPKAVFNPEESSSEGQKIKQQKEEQKIVLDFKATLVNLEEQAEATRSAKDCEEVIRDIDQYCASLQNVKNSVYKEQLGVLQTRAKSLRGQLSKGREAWALQEAAEKHRGSCNHSFDLLQAAFDDPNADKDKLSTDLSDYIAAREIEINLAEKENSTLFNAILADLSVFKQKAEKLQKAELERRRTFAGHLFEPMPDGGNPELLKNVLYFSIIDGCVFCQGLDLKGKPYGEKLWLEPDLSLLSDPDFQRDALTILADLGLVSYSAQQDLTWVLDKLCKELNAVKDSIIDREDPFHTTLNMVGVIYNDEKKEYSVNLNEAQSSIGYRNYICNPDYLIAAAFDDAAAKKYQAEAEKFHAAQFKFNVSPEDCPVQNQNLSKAIDEAKQLQSKKLVKSQPVSIEEDRERAKAYLSGEARAELEKAEEIMRQQQVLAEAYKLQDKWVAALKPSVQALQEEKETLRKQKKFEAEMKVLVDDEKRIPIENDEISQKLATLLEQVNNKNDEFGQLSGKVRLEKGVREEIKEAIDALISKHERFAVKPASLWIRFSRSARSERLAEWLQAIKMDLKKSDVSMSDIRAQLNTAILTFKESSDKNTDLSDFEKKINALPVLHSKSGKISEFAQKQETIFSEQSKIMVEGILKLNQDRSANDKTLAELGLRKISLQREMDELKPQVAAIEERLQQEKIENESLQRVKLLKRKSSSQQCLAEGDKEWASNFLVSLQKQKAKKASREALLASTDDDDKAAQSELLASVKKAQKQSGRHQEELQNDLIEITAVVKELDGVDSEESNSLFATSANFFRRAFSAESMSENLTSPLFSRQAKQKAY